MVQKLVLFLLFGSVFVGAMMPSGKRALPASNRLEVTASSSVFDRHTAPETMVDLGTGTITLDRVSLGPKEVRGMRAAVIDGGDQSLLGQSFLSQFASVSIEGDTMVLR